MPVSPEEKQKYEALITDQVTALKCLDINRNELVWHYTSGNALLNIVASGKLYATQVSCLNDSTEVRYGETLLRDAFADLHAQGSWEGDEAQLLDQIIKANAEETARPDHRPSDWFVTW